jgi:hypothetical protein
MAWQSRMGGYDARSADAADACGAVLRASAYRCQYSKIGLAIKSKCGYEEMSCHMRSSCPWEPTMEKRVPAKRPEYTLLAIQFIAIRMPTHGCLFSA